MIIIALIELVGLILSIVSVVMCLTASSMTLYAYDSSLGQTTAVDVTTYIQVISSISMGLHGLGALVALINFFLSVRSLNRLNNKIDRRTYGKNNMTLHYDLPLFIMSVQRKIYMP